MRNRNNYKSLNSAIDLLSYELDAKNIKNEALSYLLQTITNIASNKHILEEVDSPAIVALRRLSNNIAKKSMNNTLQYEDVLAVILLWQTYNNFREIVFTPIKHYQANLMIASLEKLSSILDDLNRYQLLSDGQEKYIRNALEVLELEPNEYSNEDLKNIYNKIYAQLRSDYEVVLSGWSPFIIKEQLLSYSSPGMSPRFFDSIQQQSGSSSSLPSTPGKDLQDAMEEDDDQPRPTKRKRTED